MVSNPITGFHIPEGRPKLNTVERVKFYFNNNFAVVDEI